MTIPENYRKQLEDRFYSKVLKTSTCWLWIGTRNQKGYGRFHYSSKRVAAHRWSYEHHTGNTIPDDKEACHSCDTPRCVNPGHIFIGTRSENMLDASSKGRLDRRTYLKNEDHSRAILTNDDVMRLVLTKEFDSKRFTEIAKIFGVSASAIKMAMRGSTFSTLHSELKDRPGYHIRLVNRRRTKNPSPRSTE